MKQDNIRKLKLLEEETASCTKCELHKSRIKPVFSRGNPEAKICFCGMNAGSDENESGIPFIGRSGKLLNQAIEELGYNIETDIYVMNAVKCHSPNNRVPEPEEIAACEPYLVRHLELLPAKIIITLGAFPMRLLTDETRGITKARGSWSKWKDKEVLFCCHPSFILRQGGDTSEQYQEFKSDLQQAFDKAQTIKEQTNE